MTIDIEYDAIALGRARTALHRGQRTQRIMSEDHDVVGIAGEIAFAKEFGLRVDVERKIAGDGGIDFIMLIGTIDTKTFRKPYNLIFEVGKTPADILVLAQYYDKTVTATLLGWEYGKTIMACPQRKFGGIMNYYKSAASLRKICELHTIERIATTGRFW